LSKLRIFSALRHLPSAICHLPSAISHQPSAISLQIKSLEDEQRVSLFDRSRRQVTLTEAGQLALVQAEVILAQYDDMANQLYVGPGLSGRLKIGAIQTALAGALPDALVWIKNHHPKLHISVVSGMSSELALSALIEN